MFHHGVTFNPCRTAPKRARRCSSTSPQRSARPRQRKLVRRYMAALHSMHKQRCCCSKVLHDSCTCNQGAWPLPGTGVEHLLRDVKDATVGMLAMEVGRMNAGLQALKSRLAEVAQYLRLVVDGRLPVNHDIIYDLQVGTRMGVVPREQVPWAEEFCVLGAACHSDAAFNPQRPACPAVCIRFHVCRATSTVHSSKLIRLAPLRHPSPVPRNHCCRVCSTCCPT